MSAGLSAPADEAGIAEAVRVAHDAAEPLLVQGSGSKSAMLRPVQAARTLSTANYAGVTLYAPKELILAARAGTPVAEIEAMLAAEGQFLIAEPPDLSALLGAGMAGEPRPAARSGADDGLGDGARAAPMDGLPSPGAARAGDGPPGRRPSGDREPGDRRGADGPAGDGQDPQAAAAQVGDKRGGDKRGGDKPAAGWVDRRADGAAARRTGAGAGAPRTAGQTLGGVVASNLSGPRRIAGGAMRDHVLGVRAVTGAGAVIRSGGRVLKNVTGLDLCKLLTGSHGTLGVLTEITLKVLPAPERSATVAVGGVDAVSGVAALAAALGSPYGVTGAAWLPEAAAAAVPGLPPRAVALLRIEEFAASVAYRSGRLRDELAAFGPAAIIEDAPSRVVWRAIRDAVPLCADLGAGTGARAATEAAEAVWRVSVRPSRGPAVLAATAAAGLRGFLDWGGGLVWLAGPASFAAHQAVMAAVQAVGGTWTLLRAPEALRIAVAVVPPEPEPLARITARVKAVMDPARVLNPGRIYAGI